MCITAYPIQLRSMQVYCAMHDYSGACSVHLGMPINLNENMAVCLSPSGVRQEGGQEAAEEVCEGLVLLHEQGNRCARYWVCPACDQKFHSSRDYLTHVELAHEEVAVQVSSWRCTAGGDFVKHSTAQHTTQQMRHSSALPHSWEGPNQPRPHISVDNEAGFHVRILGLSVADISHAEP